MIPSKGSVSPKRNTRKSTAQPGMRKSPIPKPAIVEISSAAGTTAEDDEHARKQQGAHVRDVERLDEVAPLGVGRPRKAAWNGAGRMEGGREDAHERQDHNGRERQQQRSARVGLAAARLSSGLLAGQALDRQDEAGRGSRGSPQARTRDRPGARGRPGCRSGCPERRSRRPVRRPSRRTRCRRRPARRSP